eukprot:Em0015g355a
MRHVSKRIVDDNIQGELAPFSFTLTSGGEELRAAPLVFIPNLIQKVTQLLDENHRTSRLTWHNGVIPENEVWLKLGGDKGGGTFKANFQIVNVAAPNSVQNTCVFCCFAAGDSFANLHIALDRYKEQCIKSNEITCRQYTLKVFLSGDYEFLSKFYGLSGASGAHPCPFCLIANAEMATPLIERGHAPSRTLDGIEEQYLFYLVSGSVRKQAQHFYNCIFEPIFNIPLEQQSAERTKSVEQLEAKIAASTRAVKKGFLFNEGPFVKELDKALQGFGVHRQQYFGGAFVGNHVHAALKVSNINKWLTSILCAARANLPHKAEMVENETVKFLNVFTLFAKCHAIYDNNFIDETNVEKLGQCIKEFLSYFRTAFPGATIPIKMHMLEDHATEWVRLTHVGFGLLGEQGAESIHAKFNSLGRAYTAIPDRVERLKCIMKEHLVSIAPDMVAAIPPPKKRKKSLDDT